MPSSTRVGGGADGVQEVQPAWIDSKSVGAGDSSLMEGLEGCVAGIGRERDFREQGAECLVGEGRGET